MDNVNGLINDLRATVREVGMVAQNANNTLALVDGVIADDVAELMDRAKLTMDEVDSLLNAFESTSGNADELIVDMRDAVNRLSNSGLTDLEETVDAIRRLVLSLGRVADALEKSPLEFISGSESDTVELPQ